MLKGTIFHSFLTAECFKTSLDTQIVAHRMRQNYFLELDVQNQLHIMCG